MTPVFVGLPQSYYDIQFAQLAHSMYSTLWWIVVWMSLGIIPFSKIFLTVLFDTLTNHVSFLFLFLIKHLFKCVALLCIYIIVVLLFIYICGIWIPLCMYFHMSSIWFFVPHIDRQKRFWNCKVAILVRHFIQLDIDKVPRWDENVVIQQSV